MNRIMLIFLLIFTPLFAFARFGKYGIEQQDSFDGYLQYVGQTVKYVKGEDGNETEMDKSFIKGGGDYDKEYTILKITGNKDKITFLLQENNGKTKVRLVARNRYYFYDNSRISDVPLLLIGLIEQDKQLFANQSSSVIVSDIQLHKRNGQVYPNIVYVITDRSDASVYYSDVENIADLNDLGKVFTNPKFKCTYKIVNVFIDETETVLLDWRKHYLLKNSIDGTTEDMVAKYFDSNSNSVFERAGAGQFYATLKEVEKPSNPAVRYGTTTSVSDKNITKFSYIDNYIDILIFAGEKEFYFTIKNISSNTIKVVWNEAVFVDVNGSTSKIMHTGIKYSQRDADQSSSTIIKGAKLDDLATPINKVYYDDILKMWDRKSLYEDAEKGKENQILQLMLPIQVKDVINEYVFKFELTYKYKHPEYLVDL